MLGASLLRISGVSRVCDLKSEWTEVLLLLLTNFHPHPFNSTCIQRRRRAVMCELASAGGAPKAAVLLQSTMELLLSPAPKGLLIRNPSLLLNLMAFSCFGVRQKDGTRQKLTQGQSKQCLHRPGFSLSLSFLQCMDYSNETQKKRQ